MGAVIEPGVVDRAIGGGATDTDTDDRGVLVAEEVPAAAC
jgi:hypothetical protein